MTTFSPNHAEAQRRVRLARIRRDGSLRTAQKKLIRTVADLLKQECDSIAAEKERDRDLGVAA